MADTTKPVLKYVPVNYEILIRGMSQFTGTKLITAADLLYVLSLMQENINKKTQELNLPLQNYRLMFLAPTTRECNYAVTNDMINYYKLIDAKDKKKTRSLLPLSCRVSEYVKNANAIKYEKIEGFKLAQHRNIYIMPDYPINLTAWKYNHMSELLNIIDSSIYEMQFVCQVAKTAKERNELRLELIDHINNLFSNPAKNNPTYFPLWGEDKTIKPFRFAADKEENDLIWREVLVSAIEKYKNSGALEINAREIPINTHVFKSSEDIIDALKYGVYDGMKSLPSLIDMIDNIRARQKAGEIIPLPTVDDTDSRIM